MIKWQHKNKHHFYLEENKICIVCAVENSFVLHAVPARTAENITVLVFGSLIKK